jgi:hypothetical protein
MLTLTQGCPFQAEPEQMRYTYACDVTDTDARYWVLDYYVVCRAQPFHNPVENPVGPCPDIDFAVRDPSGLAICYRASPEGLPVAGRYWDYERVPTGVLVPTLYTAPRVHPASIGGLVVGAMGVFIFGLFLRRWLIERKALASPPAQDMAS